MTANKSAEGSTGLPRYVVIAVFAVCCALGVSGIIPLPRVEFTWPSDSQSSWQQQYFPVYRDTSGTELVMVYLGAASCFFSNDESLPSLIEEVKLALREKAWVHELSFSTIGVAVDRRVEDGISHLAKFGIFDEVMTGRSWYGTGARQYYFDLLPGVASTPQVLVYRREMHVPLTGQPDSPQFFTGETEIVRKEGLDEIRNWLDRGLPMPQDLLQGRTSPKSQL
ncbi:MAG: hypothetical protein OXL40_12280 [Bacteroidota bacterium]|nr:hypothetical protein [Bacteroidota bacterium]